MLGIENALIGLTIAASRRGRPVSAGGIARPLSASTAVTANGFHETDAIVVDAMRYRISFAASPPAPYPGISQPSRPVRYNNDVAHFFTSLDPKQDALLIGGCAAIFSLAGVARSVGKRDNSSNGNDNAKSRRRR